MAKIAIDARESGTSTGRYIDNLIKYLHEAKPEHEIILLTKKHRVDYLKAIAPDFKVVAVPYREFTFSEQLGYWWYLRKLNADLVHFGMTHQPVLYRGKTITTVHDLTTVRFRNPSKNWLVFTVKQQVYKWVIKVVARKSEAIITPSLFVKKDLVAFSNADPHKIYVTYEAAEEFRTPAEPIPGLTGKDFILFNGRPLPHKNLHRLIEAFNVIHVKHPNMLLVIAGKKDASFNSYMKLVRKLKLEDAVIFTDFIPDGQLKWAFRHCKAYVYPSLSEGFGLPGLEAMHYGAPLVTSNVTSMPEIYGDAAHYFNPTKVYDMATKIEEVITNPSLRAKLISQGKVQVARYSWRRMAEQTLKLYDKNT